MQHFTVPENYTPADDALRNKTVLITGAGDGLGKALAMNAATRGATVILLGRTVREIGNRLRSNRKCKRALGSNLSLRPIRCHN